MACNAINSLHTAFLLFPVHTLTSVYWVIHHNFSFTAHTLKCMQRMRWMGHVAHVGNRTGAYRVMVGKTEGKRPLVRPRNKLEDNIKMDLNHLGWEGQDWIDLAQTGKSYGLLWEKQWIFGFHKMQEISWLADELGVRFSKGILLHGITCYPPAALHQIVKNFNVVRHTCFHNSSSLHSIQCTGEF